MQSQDFIKFIENLSLVKDIELKSQLIKEEITRLNKMLKDSDYSETTSKFEKVQKQTEYMEMLSYKNVLAFRLSILDSRE